MKTLSFNKIIPALFLVLMILTTAEVFAQRGRANLSPRAGKTLDEMPERPARDFGFCRNLPDITQEQLDQIDALRLLNMKENQQLRNQLNEKRARLRTLSTSDQPDTRAINSTIDEMANLRAEIQKNQMATHQEIRKLLNDDQRVIFDSRKQGAKAYGMEGNRRPGRKGPGYRGACPYTK
jgi:Spy/CpxP family protein refolding chaperone